ncbi:Ig-like domain-containing protein [Flavobacterium soyangense]|uniref:Ig-like domain-containing protein n=1 Tax=Flavobacterium soyangense TaxID=2023265 RepID=A0A930XTF5_9FLAO|nr:Ig-like domain-containing protein [Flavobacterium soyangense]MBF2707415.1 Ig-like domain-containing protein [Flavobacterium soyangense]
MLKNNFKYILLLLVLTMVGCAKRGSITGGLKDTIAPVLKMSFPKNFSTNFKGNEIKLTFDEYIKLKDLKKQLIISPPMKNEPLILPTTTSKYLTIKINDTLKPNTTYSFNFGQSIEDNNEGNPYNQFKYVFSTGENIDSLTLSGSVKDAYNKEVESFVSVMLYDVNDKFKDSVVYNQTPRYITNTLDSLKTFKLENLKAGKYLLVAMKDYNSNNKFNPKKDKIGFKKEFITIPNDTTYELKLFKEVLPFKAYKPIQTSGNKLILPFEGKTNDVKITLKNGAEILPTIITKFPKKDSLQVWFKPLKVDSLSLAVGKDKYKEKFAFKIKTQKKDTLNISAVQTSFLNFRERFTLESATPLTKFDNSKIKLINKDSVLVDFKTEYDDFNQRLYFDFKKEPSEKYTFEIMPGAFTDYLGKSNEKIIYTLNTKSFADYGNLIVTLKNAKRFPLIVELTNEKGDVLASEYSENNAKIEFNLVDPTLFWLRLIYDDNKNKIWDSGNYLEKHQAEEVIYFSKGIDVRANWDVEQVFDVSIPYTPEPKKKVDKKKKDKSIGF